MFCSSLACDHSDASTIEPNRLSVFRSTSSSLNFAAFARWQSRERKRCDFADSGRDFGFVSPPTSASTRRFIPSIRSVIDHSLFLFRYPADYIYQLLPDLLVNLPYAMHPSLLAPSTRLLLFLLHSQLLSATVVLSFLVHRIAELASLHEDASIRCVEAIAPLAVQLVLMDASQFRSLLSVFHCIDETSEKRIRLDAACGEDDIVIPENSSIWVFFFLLQVMNALLIHLNHKREPFFPSSIIGLLESLRSALIQHFSRVILPPHSILKPSISPIAASLPLTRSHLVVCLEVCLTQLLEDEKELRKRLVQYILQSLNTPISDPSEQRNDLCTVLFDGSSNSLRLLQFTGSSSLRAASSVLSLSSFSQTDLLLALAALLPSLLCVL